MNDLTYGVSRQRREDAGRISILGLSKILFYAFFLTKPFYLFSSGTLQIGDICLSLSLVCYLLYSGLSFRVERIDFTLVAFVACVVLVNSTYAAVFNNRSIAFTSLYYVFNLMAVILFRSLGKDEEVLKRVSSLLRFSLIVQAAIYLLNMGRWYAGSRRYMGTFNDPNQFGVYVLFSLLMIRLIERKLDKKRWFTDDILAVCLIASTASTGMFLGLAVYYFCHLAMIYREGKLNRVKALHFILTVAALLCALVILYSYSDVLYERFYIIRRVINKIRLIFDKSSLSSTGFFESGFFRDRGLTKAFHYPEYFLIGSGEGLYSRFSEIHSDIELHSTFLGFCFYYGILPFCLFLLWLINNLRGMGKCGSWVEIVPLIIESLTLANHRQPLFWMLLIMTSLIVKSRFTECNEMADYEE